MSDVVAEPVIYERKLPDDVTEDQNDTKGKQKHTNYGALSLVTIGRTGE